MRFSENRSTKFSTFNLDFDPKNMKIGESRKYRFWSSSSVDSESGIKISFFGVAQLDGATLN